MRREPHAGWWRPLGPVWIAAGLLAAVFSATLGAAAIAQGEDPAARPSGPPTGGTTSAEVVARLREIFRVHDAALLTQDESMLASVFDPDCACLEATRARIRRLRDSGLLWSDYASTITGAQVHPPKEGTWTVTATLTGSLTLVETEARELVRILPPERRRWEFRLRRTTGGGPMVLTAAEPRW